jgi:purine-binding chemotaxis protein CheW
MTELRERERIQLIVFSLNEVEFAVPIEQVWRVEPLAEQVMTRVPRAPGFLEGVINVRGQVVPVLDLKKRFGLPSTEWPAKARLLVAEVENQRVGMMVDTVSDILWFATAKVEPPPPMVAQISGVFVQGVGKEDDRLLIILDLEQVLSPEEREELAEMQTETDQ